MPAATPPVAAGCVFRGEEETGHGASHTAGRAHLGEPVAPIEVPRAARARPGAAGRRRIRDRGDRARHPPRRSAAGPEAGRRGRGRARCGREGGHRGGVVAGVPRHLLGAAQGVLRSAAAERPRRQGRRADPHRGEPGPPPRARPRPPPALRERGRGGRGERRVRVGRAVHSRSGARTRGTGGPRDRRSGGGRTDDGLTGRSTMPATKDRPIAIYYEHPDWFRPLFAELDRRATPYVKIHAAEHRFDPAGEPQYSLVFNRMSPSAWLRGNGHSIFYTLQYLAHLKERGVRVVNGYTAFLTEISKAYQLALFERLGLPYPKARVIHNATDAPAAAEGLRFPVVVKPNIGGSGAGIRRFDQLETLARASANGLELGIDGTALVQEFIPTSDGAIVRVEVLGGRFLYAIRVVSPGDTFNLCPADVRPPGAGAG